METLDLNYTVSPRMMFALREKLEEEGLGNSPQAETLERAFITNRRYILEEMGPLFRQMDKSRVSRTANPNFWWWKLDDEKVVAAVSRQFQVRIRGVDF